MAYIKPGTVKGVYTWTGKRWVRTPVRMSDKVSLKKEIERETPGTHMKSVQKQSQAKVKYPGGSPSMSKSSPMYSGKTSAEGPKRSIASPTAAQIARANKTTQNTTSTTRPAPSGNSSSSSTTKKTAKTPAKKTAPVSQSNTMWVKKGETVGGQTVKKGYLAQYGKPQKKVTANVKLVVDTTRGKAGSKVSYTKGRATKKQK